MPLVSEDLSLLVLVVDVNPFFWALRPPSLPTFHDFLSQLRVFLNAYLLLHSANRAAVIATGHSCCAFVHPPTSDTSAASSSSSSSSSSSLSSPSSPAEAAVSQLLSFATAETERAKREAAAGTAEGGESAGREDGDGGTERMEGVEGNGAMDREMRDREGSQEGGVSGGREGGESGGKGLVGDQASLLSGYVAIMNAIFSSQKAAVPIDACAIGEADSAFLQQAAFLTGGLYLHSTRPNALLQDLLLVFGVDQFSRDFITLPQPSAVDFRASCFCHKRPVDMGFVCSVCLSIFCSPARTCATCG
ncbi:unnamed protein product [Closterium sp. NIES-64]|nr:unnamed protein product [Closterium sp. NIES-64]